MRLFWWLLKQPVPKQIERYSRFSPSPLSIKQFLDFGECGAAGPHGRHVPHSPRDAGPLPSRPAAGLPGLGAKSVGTAGGAPGCPGFLPGTRISGRRGAGPGAHTPARALPENPETASEDPYRAGRPRPASVASNLLDTDLTALKT